MSGVDELLDLVNEHDEVVGQVRRSEAWARRLPVRGVNAFVRNSRGQLWFPRRTADKRHYPNCLDMSVGGHVESGEDYLIRIPLHSCTVGKAPPVHPYRRIRIFSYSHPPMVRAVLGGFEAKI